MNTFTITTLILTAVILIVIYLWKQYPSLLGKGQESVKRKVGDLWKSPSFETLEDVLRDMKNGAKRLIEVAARADGSKSAASSRAEAFMTKAAREQTIADSFSQESEKAKRFAENLEKLFAE